MKYDFVAIRDSEIPVAAAPEFQHVVHTYVSETNKTASMWKAIPPELIHFTPHEKTNSLRTILKHQLLSERRFCFEFVGLQEPPVEELLPTDPHAPVDEYIERYVRFARLRIPQLAKAESSWWMEEADFFGYPRQRIWTFWRRVLHTCHHRTQVQTWLRMAGAHVPTIYGPSGDVTWDGATPTYE